PPRPPHATLFPYTTLFRSQALNALHLVSDNPGWLTSTSLALIAVILVNIWIGIPFNTTILYGGLQEIPEELYEAAALDGATGWKIGRAHAELQSRSDLVCR